MDITAIDPNDKRYGRLWKLIPVLLAAINENVALFPQFVFSGMLMLSKKQLIGWRRTNGSGLIVLIDESSTADSSVFHRTGYVCAVIEHGNAAPPAGNPLALRFVGMATP